MQFKIQPQAFLKPLRLVGGVVERKHAQTAPILSNVFIKVFEDRERFQLITTDQEVELIAGGTLEEKAETAGAVTVPVRKLLDICRTLPEGALLSLTEEKDRVILKSNRSRFALLSLPAETFPKLEDNFKGTRFTLTERALRSLIEKTGFAMAEQDVRYYLNGMLLEVKGDRVSTVASDGHRLAVSKITASPKESETLKVIVPRKGILELLRILGNGEDPVTVILGNNHIRAITREVIMTSKLLEGRFPDYEHIIPNQGDKVVVGQRERLKEAFLRVSSVFTDKFRGVRLRLSSGCLKILATNSEQDEVEEDLEVEYEGAAAEFCFNIKYLIDLLTVIQSEHIRFIFSDPNSSAKVEGVGDTEETYVIMPMKI